MSERWKHGKKLSDGIGLYHPSLIYDANGDSVCTVYGFPLNCSFTEAGVETDPRYAEPLRRAKLITRTPELHDALREVLTAIEMEGADGERYFQARDRALELLRELR